MISLAALVAFRSLCLWYDGGGIGGALPSAIGQTIIDGEAEM
jgi:hypothetical protein